MVPVPAHGISKRCLPRKSGFRLHVRELLQPDTGDFLVQQPRLLRLQCLELHIGCSQGGAPAVGGCAGRAVMVPVGAHGLAERSLPREPGFRLHVRELLQPDTGDLLVQQPRVLWLQCFEVWSWCFEGHGCSFCSSIGSAEKPCLCVCTRIVVLEAGLAERHVQRACAAYHVWSIKGGQAFPKCLSTVRVFVECSVVATPTTPQCTARSGGLDSSAWIQALTAGGEILHDLIAAGQSVS
jgi:hypothetical protein